jgi:hypothetical protein
MSPRFLSVASLTTGAVGVAVVLGALSYQTASAQSGQAGAANSPVAKTPWGDPDLQGIWTVETMVPVERPAGVAKEFYSDEEIAKLDVQRAEKSVFGNHVREQRGSEAEFTSQRRTGRRTSMVVDPPDGKIPGLVPEALARQAKQREYQNALIQNTRTCKEGLPGCTYGPPSPRRLEPPPMYPVNAINRADGPEDRGLGERCMSGSLPDLRGGFTGIHRRIVQSKGLVSVFYDTGQGQGFIRTIPITDRPHLPSAIRQWWGDARAKWEGDTLVIDVTNFSRKTDFQGSRENLHLTERWRRTGPKSMEIVVRIEDPTTWAKPWTVIQEFDLQTLAENKIYTEPRCHEGNYGMPAMMAGARAIDEAYAKGRGPHPGTYCVAGCAAPDAEDRDPLALR